jgi:hypothetical protein
MYIIKYTTTDGTTGVITRHDYTGDSLRRMMNVLLKQEARDSCNWTREIISISHMVEGDQIA